MCIYHSFTMEVYLPQTINTKKHSKTACSNRVIVQHVSRKYLQFYLDFKWFFYYCFTIWRLWKLRNFLNLNRKNLTFCYFDPKKKDFLPFWPKKLTFGDFDHKNTDLAWLFSIFPKILTWPDLAWLGLTRGNPALIITKRCYIIFFKINNFPTTRKK